MNKNKRNTNKYTKFRSGFSFGNFERLSDTNNVDNFDEEKENVNNGKKEIVDKKEIVSDASKKIKIPKKKIKIPKKKASVSNLHVRQSYSISVSPPEFDYWKGVAKMNKINVSTLIREIVNEYTGYEKTKEERKCD